ncbi:hypothetical protein ACLMJK_003809 [Lecanora helva]
MFLPEPVYAHHITQRPRSSSPKNDFLPFPALLTLMRGARLELFQCMRRQFYAFAIKYNVAAVSFVLFVLLMEELIGDIKEPMAVLDRRSCRGFGTSIALREADEDGGGYGGEDGGQKEGVN